MVDLFIFFNSFEVQYSFNDAVQEGFPLLDYLPVPPAQHSAGLEKPLSLNPGRLLYSSRGHVTTALAYHWLLVSVQ